MTTTNPELARLLAILNDPTYSDDTQNSSFISQVHDDRLSVQTNQSVNRSNGTPTAQDPRKRKIAARGEENTVLATKTGQDQVVGLSSVKTNGPKPPIPDSTTIISWPAALKHVTKHITSDPAFESAIKQMISDQHKHERQWHQQRIDLVKQQKTKPDSQAEAVKLLGALGVQLGKQVEQVDEVARQRDNERALSDFDAKVLKAWTGMIKHFEGELARLGVPFFNMAEKSEKKDERIDTGQMEDLRKKMIRYLEDLYGE